MRKQFILFLAVGFLNTLFGYGVFALAVFAGFHYALAVLFANILGVAFNFQTIGRIVFKSHDWHKIFKFVAVYSILYFLNVYGVGYLKSAWGAYLAEAIVILPLALLSFFLNRQFVFKPSTLN